MTTEILNEAQALGKLIAASEEVKAANAAKAAYDNDAAIQAAITEYNAHNKALSEEYKKSEHLIYFFSFIKSIKQKRNSQK